MTLAKRIERLERESLRLRDIEEALRKTKKERPGAPIVLMDLLRRAMKIRTSGWRP